MARNIVPRTDKGADLGTPAKKWNTVYTDKVVANIVDADNLGAIEQSAGDEVTLRSLIATAGSNPTSITIYDDIPITTTDLTIPSNIHLRFKDGGKLSPASGITLTVNGSIDAGLWQIFGGDGDVSGEFSCLYVLPTWFGAVGDGVTDDTDAFVKAINVARERTLFIPKGIYNVANLQLADTHVISEGMSVVFKSLSSSGDIVKMGHSVPQWTYKKIEKLRVNGNERQMNGFVFDAPSSPNISGRWILDAIEASACDKGIYKPLGNIGNIYNAPYLTGNNYGFYAKDDISMHLGCDIMNGGCITQNKIAGIYIEGHGGHITFNNTILDSNPGFGYFIKDCDRSAGGTIEIKNNWIEANRTDSTVIIEGYSYEPYDFHIDNSFVIITNTPIPSINAINNAHVVLNDCWLMNDRIKFNCDASSIIQANGMHLRAVNGLFFPVIVNTISGYISHNPIAPGVTFFCPKRELRTGHLPFTHVSKTMESTSDFYINKGSISTSVIATDGVTHSSCLEVVFPAGSEGFVIGTIENNKYLLATASFKLVSGNADNITIKLGGSKLLGSVASYALKTNQWVHVAGIMTTLDTGSNSFWFEIECSNEPVTLRISGVQTVLFDTEDELIAYYNSGAYYE